MLHITPKQLNWLGHRPHRSGYVVADKTPYGVYGICLHSWHRTSEAAARELNRQYRQGNSTQTIYKIVPIASQPHGLGRAPAKRRCKRMKTGPSGLKRCAVYTMQRSNFHGVAQGELDRLYAVIDSWEQVGDAAMKLVAAQVEALLDQSEDLPPAAQIDFLRENLVQSLHDLAQTDNHWNVVLFGGE